MPEDPLANFFAQISAQVSQGNLQLARDRLAQIELPTFQQISLPTSYAGLTGFLPTNYNGPYAGGAAWDALAQTAGMFGRTGNDARWDALGYGQGTSTLGGRAQDQAEQGQAGSQAARDTQMSMDYGGAPIVGGTPAPDWMAPHAAWAQQFARTHGGRPPTQAELQTGINDTVNTALGELRQSPEYQAADRARKVAMEAQQIGGALGMSPQNAANLVQDLRTATDRTGRQSSPLEIVDAVARWQDPQDPATAINQAMTRLRLDPAYNALDGPGRVQREAQEVAKAINAPIENATAIVNELRSGTQYSQGLSQNEAVLRAVQRNLPAGTDLNRNGQQAAGVYGQMGTGATASSQVVGAQGDMLDASGDRFTMFSQSGGGGGGAGGVNFAGSGAPSTYGSAAMSPEQRRLAEQARATDLSAQIQLRQQDITNQLSANQQRIQEEENLRQNAIAQGNLALAQEHEKNITSLNSRTLDLTQQKQEADVEAEKARLALQTGEAVGTVGGDETLAARTQRQQEERLRQQMAQDDLYRKQQLASTLRGPEDIVQYAKVVGGTPGGIGDLLGAATGRFRVASQGDVTADPRAASFASLPGGTNLPTISDSIPQPYGGVPMAPASMRISPFAGQTEPFRAQNEPNRFQAVKNDPSMNPVLRAGGSDQGANGAAVPPGSSPAADPMQNRFSLDRGARQQQMVREYNSNPNLGQDPGAMVRRTAMQSQPPQSSSQQVLAASAALASPDQWAWQEVDKLAPTNQTMLKALSEGQGRRIEDINATRERVLGRYRGPRAGAAGSRVGF